MFAAGGSDVGLWGQAGGRLEVAGEGAAGHTESTAELVEGEWWVGGVVEDPGPGQQQRTGADARDVPAAGPVRRDMAEHLVVG